MADEAPTSATTTEQATPAIATEAVNETSVADTAEAEDPTERILEPGEEDDTLEVEAPAVEDDAEDVEWNGKTFKAPKGVKDGILMQSDYTKKTQAVSERVKALDTREAEITQQAAATEEELRDRAVLLGVNAQLEQYKSVDWVQLARTDPVGYGEHQARYMQLQQAATETAESLKTKQTERTQKAERELATRVEETLKFAAEKGIKSETIAAAVNYAESKGIPAEAIQKNWSPIFLELLHEARIGSMMLRKQTAPPPRVPAVPLKPLATVGGKSTPASSSDLATADMAAYVAARKKGIGGPAPR